MNTTIQEMAEKLRLYDNYAIVYHIRPDGDCIGSAYALALVLKSIGKACAVLGSDPVPMAYRYMTDAVSQDNLRNLVYISVDAMSPQRLGVYAERPYTFCIDHHRNNSIDATYKYVEEDCGACSEIILKLIRAMEIPVTPQMANFLYMALVMDTRCFQTYDTSAQSFETAAALARLGADVYGIGRRHAFIKSEARFKLEELLQKSLHFSCGGKLITGIILLKDLETAGIADSEIEGINSYVEQYADMKIGVTVRELPDGRSRCSTRTSGNLSANDICAVHGGGGHFHAAVCELPDPPERARIIMEETCRQFLKEEEPSVSES